jgi:ATP-binding cassette subfamily F protein uup
VLFQGLSLKILRGDRLGLVGNNGVGKTTLLRILLGELQPRTGAVRLGVNLEIAYFDQLRSEFDPTKTVAEIVADGSDHVTIGGKDRHVIGYLKGFLFSAERAAAEVEALSGGERNRVLLARLFARPRTLVLTSRPTTWTWSWRCSRSAPGYQGTLIVVSHDRAFSTTW